MPAAEYIAKPTNRFKFVDEHDTADVLNDNPVTPATGSIIRGVVPGIFVPEVPGGPGPAIAAKIVELNADPPPINNPDVLPVYPGGMDALRKFLEQNLRNPRYMEEGETVTVQVKFVVGFDGKLQSFEIIENGGNEFNDEVLRVLKKMPSWIPGKSKGQNVPVYYIIPVKFIAAG